METFDLMALALRIWVLFLIAGLLILTLLLLFKRLRRALGRVISGSKEKSASAEEAGGAGEGATATAGKVSEVIADSAAATLALPASPQSPFPSLTEQQTVFEQLAGLPQFCRLQNGSLVEWSTGASIAPCDCHRSDYPTPHLMLRWPGDSSGVGIVSQRALTALLDSHLAWARQLGADKAIVPGSSAAASASTTAVTHLNGRI
jgi:hypothetical protein